MKKKNLKWFWLFIPCTVFVLLSCEKDHTDSVPDLSEAQKVNQFIYSDVKDYYLWTAAKDWSHINPETETDPFDFFESLMYRPTDKWSMLTDNAEGFYNMLDGIGTTFGYELTWAQLNTTERLCAIVLYVYPNSPAEKAGLVRGDFLVAINENEYITNQNYTDLYNAPSITLRRAYLTDSGTLTMDSKPVYMEAVLMYEDPVIKDTVVVKGTHRIGYLCYTNYTKESESRLLEVFAGFKAEGVTDVVLDLRYNGGGYAETSRLLSSILAPDPVAKGKEIFLTQTWNQAMMDLFKRTGEDTNEYFMDDLSVNMDLSRLYVLTLEFTASASEATIMGLRPYMDVIQIGEPTHGKWYGGGLISPMVYDDRKKEWITDKEIENWMMYLMIYRYADRDGNTSFSGNTLVPDIYAGEKYTYLLPQLGDERDPLFGKAVELITGESVNTRSAQSRPYPYTIRDVRLRSSLNGKMIDEKFKSLPH